MDFTQQPYLHNGHVGKPVESRTRIEAGFRSLAGSTTIRGKCDCVGTYSVSQGRKEDLLSPRSVPLEGTGPTKPPIQFWRHPTIASATISRRRNAHRAHGGCCLREDVAL